MTKSCFFVSCDEKEDNCIYVFPNNGEATFEWDRTEKLPIPTKEGYHIDGYYLDEAFTQKVTVEDGYAVSISNNDTIYIKWDEHYIDSNGKCYYCNYSLSGYTLLPNITGYTFYVTTETDQSEYIVPAYAEDGKPITAIGENAFFLCRNLKKVVIPDPVTRIGRNAFRSCTELTDVSLPISLTDIENGAFSLCSKLESIDLPYLVNSVGEDAFHECYALKKVSGPSNVVGKIAYQCRGNIEEVIITSGETIPYEAFDHCFSLISIDIPKTVTSIEDKAFSFCTSLENINVAEDNLRYSSVSGCLIDKKTKTLVWGRDVESIPTDGSVTKIGNYAFYYNQNLKNITIPNIIETIESEAFKDCFNLRKVSFDTEGNFKGIGVAAFYGCDNLVSINLPKSLKWIYEEAFHKCDSLWEICNESTLDIQKGSLAFGEIALNAKNIIDDVKDSQVVITDDDYIIYNDDNEKLLLSYFGNEKTIIIPNGITVINQKAFHDNNIIVDITFPNTLHSISDYAFQNCSAIKNIDIPNSVKTIGNSAFRNCCSLVSVKLHDGLENIGSFAFSDCSDLNSIMIPSTVIKIGISPFDNCNNLKQIDISENNLYYCVKNNCLVEIGSRKILNALNVSNIQIDDSILIIGSNAFSGCDDLTNLVLPEGLESIEANAFNYCKGTVCITIPKSVKFIDNRAFYGSNGIQINYLGTVDKWYALNSGKDWNLYIDNYTINCSDGVIKG